MNNAYAWGMALTVVAQSLLSDYGWIPFLVLVAAYIGFAVADTRAVRAAGYRASLMLALMLGIVYLWMRPKKTGQGYVIPIVATVGSLGAIALKAL
ncbi:hypothetical protein [Actinoplanes sp. L3-i22]|uniref:hypothetical protein n=1 Tax=Actinoplanes sp. L3-i22 TaxID=2836373 RepID=UPI001C749817|nr:hypothetical protein [Actinoplanes sp. L3-i22]BCY05397.1 hypothetical protein L3i22_004850 [Actinoplanes sp. L3-i22]